MEQTTEHTAMEIIRRSTGLVSAIGILLIVLGALALAAPLAAGLSIAVAVGVLLLVGGIGQLVFAFRAGSFGAGLLMFLLGGLKAFVGILMILQPALGLISLTALLAAYFVVEGVFEMIWALQLRPHSGWGWAFASGVAALVLGMMIWAEFPFSGVWAVGMLVGLKLIFSGTSLTFLSGAARRVATPAAGQ